MKGVQKGRKEELQRLQQILMNIVRVKYPYLADLAQQRASHVDNPDKFQFLIEHVVSAPMLIGCVFGEKDSRIQPG